MTDLHDPGATGIDEFVTEAELEGPSTAPPPRKLYRSTEDRMVAGLAGGIGEYLDIDPVWIRLAFVALTLGGGAGVLLYIVGWIIVPERPEGAPVERTGRPKASTSATLLIGAALIVLGGLALLDNVLPWANEVMWPLIIVGIGAALVLRGGDRE